MLHLPRFFMVLCCALSLALTPEWASAQCSELASGLLNSRGITHSNLGNIIVAEGGTLTSNSGRISIVDRNGTRRTLLDGLPSASLMLAIHPVPRAFTCEAGRCSSRLAQEMSACLAQFPGLT
jgi:hypothetical protein